MMEGKRMTWQEIKEAYPNQVVGLVDCLPNDINFKTAVVKYAESAMPYDKICEKAFDGVYVTNTADEDIMLIL